MLNSYSLRRFLAALLATGSPASFAVSTIDTINQAIQQASTGETVDFPIQEDILIPSHQVGGDPYAAQEWGAIINPEGVTLQISGLQSNGQKSSFTGGERTEFVDLTRPLLNQNGASMKLENLTFDNCYYYRKGRTAPLGGAIANFGGTLEVRSCDFNGNGIRGYDRFCGGGAIASAWPIQNDPIRPSTTLLIDCTFTGNFATTDPAIDHSAQGGAFYNDEISPSIVRLRGGEKSE